MKKMLAVAVLLACGSQAALADNTGLNVKNMYFGAGVNINQLSGWSDATGFQFFGGYDLNPNLLPKGRLAVEVGYLDTGTFDRTAPFFPYYSQSTQDTGLWASGLYSIGITRGVDLLGRLGADFGDDSGLLLGIGAGFKVSPQIQVRGEYVIRDHVDSIQANFVYHM